MIGQSEIHDFLRFAQNPGLTMFADQTASPRMWKSIPRVCTGRTSNASRRLQFCRSGVEDDNAFFDIKINILI